MATRIEAAAALGIERSAQRPGVTAAFCRAALAVAVLLAAAAAALWTHAAPTPAWTATDPELLRLLRGMALIKAAMAVAGLGAIGWRLGHTATLHLAAAYVVAGALLAAGPGLMWGMAHLVAGVFVFHAGLAMLLALAWGDGQARPQHFARLLP